MKSADRILILKTGETLPSVKAKFADFEDWIAQGLGLSVADVEVVPVYQGARLPPAHEVAGAVVTGSPEMVTDRADWSEASAEWLADIVREDSIPVLGLCYGHQLLAHGLGGEVGANPRGREVGTRSVTFEEFSREASPEERALFEGLDAGRIIANFSHVESVLRPPRNARVLASTDMDPHSVIAFGRRQWGVQFHPEFDRPILEGYVEARREILAREGLDPDGLLAAVRETPASANLLARFRELSLGEC